MHHKFFFSGLLLSAALSATACHTMRFEVGDGPVGQVVEQRTHYFLVGLVPTRHIDVSQYCPAGAVAVREETTFVDGLFDLITLSIYSPRSTTYYCAVEASR